MKLSNMKKQLYRGEMLTALKCVNSIIRFYNLATSTELTEGLRWYIDANEYCRELAARFNISIHQAAGIIAAFSPQAGWTENKRYAVSFLINPKNILRSRVQVKKAKKILTLSSEADIYNAQTVADAAFKTKSFFLNILNPDVATDVTIDRHAIAVCLQSPDHTFALDASYAKYTKAQYDFFQTCYIRAAAKLDILPHQLQAITWLAYRRLRELKQHSDSNHWKPFTEETPF
jgi:hypothetical protein